MYVKDSIPEPVLKLTSDKLELISLEIRPDHYCKPFHIVFWYRPPTDTIVNTAFEELREVLKNLDAEKKEIIFIGDANCDFKSCKIQLLRNLS